MKTNLVLLPMLLLAAGCTVGTQSKDQQVADATYQYEVPGQHENWSFDVDRDDQPDFEVSYTTISDLMHPSSSKILGVSIRPLDGKEIGRTGECVGCAVAVSSQIGPEMNWSTHAAAVGGISWRRGRGWEMEFRGPWIGTEDGYMPIRVKDGDVYLYGWIRLTCSARTGEVQLLGHYVSDYTNAPVRAGGAVVAAP